MSNISIYVVAHKPAKTPTEECYKLIAVNGLARNRAYKGIKDCTGDNISAKNENYCELTAMYWIWKNDHTSDYVGICHYRRYFYMNQSVLKAVDIERKLKYADIIIPEPLTLPRKQSVGIQYSEAHHKNDLLVCREVMEELAPEYLDSFTRIMQRHYFSCYNMLIASKEIYDSYMEWLFEILFEVENRTDISGYDEYNKRIYGFLAERLFNVWLLKNRKFKTKYCPVREIGKQTKAKTAKEAIRDILFPLLQY